MFMWGAGNVCRHFLQHLKKRLPVQGIVDCKEELSGSELCGIPIYSPANTAGEQALKIRRKGGEYICPPPKDVVFVITTYVYYVSVKNYLESLGYETVFVYDLREYTTIDWSLLCRIHYDVPQERYSADIREARSILADEASVKIFDALLEKRKACIYDCTDIRSAYPQYLEMDLVPFGRDEIIVDCGAFLGDGLRAFKERLHSWKMFYCFEPDADNFRVLQKTCKSYENTAAHHAAVGDRDGTACFSVGANAGGEMQQGAGGVGQMIEVCRLDSLTLPEVTYITADIEGAEMAMLRGARQTIERCCPKLAVCVYHKAADLWEIPLWLKAVQPQYEIYLRHYGETAVDTVAYALAQP